MVCCGNTVKLMHKTDTNGVVIESTCDFCGKLWDPEGMEIMVEGHKGSLLCMTCLSAAYAAVAMHKAGAENAGKMCTMCIEERDQPQWESPVQEEKRVCLRCIKQAATALEKDEETGWRRPGKEPNGQ
jgi:hypothetical protein